LASHEVRNSGRRRCFEGGRQHSQARYRKAWRLGGVGEPGMCRSSLRGNREVPGSGQWLRASWSALGRRGAVANDERTWEVRLRHSSCEADEQSRATGGGAGGAKGGGQGECGPAKHAPGSGPGKRVTGAGAHTASSKATEERIGSLRSFTTSAPHCSGWHFSLSSGKRHRE
jgi:hypothetical protein